MPEDKIKRSGRRGKGRELTLHHYFSSYENIFSEKLSAAASEFLASKIEFKLVGIFDSPSPIWKENEYFVTQIGLSAEQHVTVKTSDTAANLIFRLALGDRPKETGYLKLKEITDLEAKILRSFNEFLYKKISENFLSPKELRSVEHTLTGKEQTIYLSFCISGNINDEDGKILILFPQFLIRSINRVPEAESALDFDYFNNCYVETDIIAGYSKITLEDVKNLEPEDIVILEKSSLYSMNLKNYEDLSFNINPDPGLSISLDDENGREAVKEMRGNIWDSLEVELSAEFKKIKIRLGDLRQVVEGLVIDVASISDNKVFLNVEEKQIAAGELVIVGDKYAVKITEVYSDAKPLKPEPVAAINQGAAESAHRNNQENNTDEETIDDSEFDFSDYEIEDDV